MNAGSMETLIMAARSTDERDDRSAAQYDRVNGGGHSRAGNLLTRRAALCAGLSIPCWLSRIFSKTAPRSVAPTPEQEGVIFRDVTSPAGIRFKHTSAATGQKYLVETMGSGCAFFDYDNDGYLDIYLVNGAPLPGFTPRQRISNALYRNNKDGTFTDVTATAHVDGGGIYGMGVAVGDYNNDGNEDLYVTGFGRSILYHNNGDGTFTDVTEAAGVGNGAQWAVSAAFLDYDNDGRLDLFVSNYLDYTLLNNVQCGARDKGLRSYCHPANYRGTRNKLYHNNGDGTFTDVSEKSGIALAEGKGMGVVAADLDGDGFVDIFVSNDTVPNFLYHNNGDGTFNEVGAFSGVAYSLDGQAKSGMGVDVGDFDGDGKPDLLLTALSQYGASLYRNDGDGLFTDVASQIGLTEPTFLLGGWGVKFLDYDNDGDQDIFITNSHVMDDIASYSDALTYKQPDLLLENRGGHFVDATNRQPALTEPRVGRGLAFGDFDNDGDMDILVSNNNGPPSLLRNDFGNRNHWVKFKLVGTKSNRNGVGAKVTVVAGDLVQTDQVKGGGSYLSAHDPRLHFGLGKRETIDSVEIHWPSGRIQRLTGVKPDRILIVQES